MAVGQSIMELLGLPSLMSVVEETTSGLPQEDFLPKEFLNTTREVIGNSAQATLLKGQRKVSRLIQYNAPPVGAVLEEIGKQNWVLMHTSEILDIDPVTFQQLRQYDNWTMQKQGAEEIGRQIGLFVKKQANLVSSCALYTLSQGVIYADQYGNLLPSSSGATQTESQLIPAGHQGQLNWDGNGALITMPWSNPTANIPLMVRGIRYASLVETGRKPTMAFYGKNVPQYIQENAYCLEYLARDEKSRSEFLASGEIPDGFLSLKWIPAWEGFYEDANGNNQQIWPSDRVTFAPKVDKTWYEMVLGSVFVPKTIDILVNAESAMSNLELVYGKFIYAQLMNIPTRLATVMGNTFLPTIKVPKCLWQSDVAGF